MKLLIAGSISGVKLNCMSSSWWSKGKLWDRVRGTAEPNQPVRQGKNGMCAHVGSGHGDHHTHRERERERERETRL